MNYLKQEIHRSEAWRRAVSSLPCVQCHKEGETQCAHPNHRGKGLAFKASDALCFPLCVSCHAEFDSGKSYTKQERRALADEWTIRTIEKLASLGLIGAK